MRAKESYVCLFLSYKKVQDANLFSLLKLTVCSRHLSICTHLGKKNPKHVWLDATCLLKFLTTMAGCIADMCTKNGNDRWQDNGRRGNINKWCMALHVCKVHVTIYVFRSTWTHLKETRAFFNFYSQKKQEDDWSERMTFDWCVSWQVWYPPRGWSHAWPTQRSPGWSWRPLWRGPGDGWDQWRLSRQTLSKINYDDRNVVFIEARLSLWQDSIG